MSMTLLRRGALAAAAAQEDPPPNGFSPDDISDLHGWYAADDLNLSDGDPIDQADDLSGNARHATASGSQRPTFRTNELNGLPGIDFDGTVPDRLETGNFTAISQATVFVVFRHATGDGNSGDGVNAYIYASTTGSQAALGVGAGSAGSDWFAFSGSVLSVSAALDTAAGRATTVFDGSNSSIDVNGAGASGNTGSRSGVKHNLGFEQHGPQAWHGLGFEWIIYNRALTSTEISDVEGYLTGKWGV